MKSVMELLILSTFVLLLFFHWLYQYVLSDTSLKKYRLPPGPKGWPLVGVLPSFIGKIGLEEFQKWSDIYGGIYFCKIGLRNLVVVTDSKVAQEMTIRQVDKFHTRPKDLLLGKILGGKGIPFNDGPSWKEHRMFVVQEFRKFGLTKPEVESRIHDEVQIFLEKLSKGTGEPTSINTYLATVTYNIIWSVISGQRFNWDDKQLSNLFKNMEANLDAVEIVGAHNYFLPLMAYQLVRNNPPKLLKIVISRFMYFNTLINSCQNRQEEEEDVISENMIFDYLKELNQRKKTNKGTTFSRTQLLFMVSDLFVAGGETTITTLQWSVLFLALYPEWQEKVREEIRTVYGKERLPSYSEKSSCPILEAFISESLRYRTATAAMWHSTTEDCKVDGYDIPANTWVLFHFQGMHNNKDNWPERDVFNPGRFLSDGVYKKNELFLPFSSECDQTGERVIAASHNVRRTLDSGIHQIQSSALNRGLDRSIILPLQNLYKKLKTRIKVPTIDGPQISVVVVPEKK
ncbi:cytochrome P450 2J4-like isoform X3 [Artemia franciscana]|uniref:cytochrome P450 2J4-like isoform X3 n=1 Tax=Artemia franciscana TaxID=6661 RepID=UPI0032DBAC78